MFVITITKSDDPAQSVEYVGIDSNSGGYPYWTNFLGSAKFFKSYASAEDFLTNSDFTKDSETTDGTVYPPRMIHSGLDLCNTKSFGSGVICIQEVVLNTVLKKSVSGIIKYRNSKKSKVTF